MPEQPSQSPSMPDLTLTLLLDRVKNLENYAHFDRCLPSEISQSLSRLLKLIKTLNPAREADRNKVLIGIENLAFLCRRYEESIQPTKTMIAIRALDLQMLEYRGDCNF